MSDARGRRIRALDEGLTPQSRDVIDGETTAPPPAGGLNVIANDAGAVVMIGDHADKPESPAALTADTANW